MKFKTMGHKVLIKPDPIWDRKELPAQLRNMNFEIVYPKDLEKREKAGTQKGTVVQVGYFAWRTEPLGWGDPNWEPWAKVGDKVLFARYAGKIVVDEDTGEEFIVVNDEDIQIIIEEDRKEAA